MSVPIYQYSTHLKQWIWLCSIHSYNNLNIPWFPKGSICYYFHIYGLGVIPWNDDFMKEVKTIQINLE